MPTYEGQTGEARRATLEKLLKALVSDPTIAACASVPEFENARLIPDVPFEDLRRMGKERELLGPFAVLFGVEHGRYFSCSSPDCARIFAKNDPRLHGGDYSVCLCGQPLRYFQNIDELSRYYGGHSGFEFNIVVEPGNSIAAFSCGRQIDVSRIDDALMGPSFPAYSEIRSSLDEATLAIRSYFDGNGNGAKTAAYFVDSGGVRNEKKTDLRYLSAVCLPVLQSALRSAQGRLVCITHRDSAMYRINLMLGFDVICVVGPFAYVGLLDVTLPLLAYQKLQPAALADLFRVLARLAG